MSSARAKPSMRSTSSIRRRDAAACGAAAPADQWRSDSRHRHAGARAQAPHVTPEVDREDVARLISKYNLLAVPVVDAAGHVIGIVTVDDVIDAMIAETTEDVQKLGGMEALDEPYNQIGFLSMIQKRAGWLSVLLVGEMLTASAMQVYEAELEKAIVLALFIPLIMSSGGNSGSQATSLIIRRWRCARSRSRTGGGLPCANCRPVLRSAASSRSSASCASSSGRSSASTTTVRTGCWSPPPSARRWSASSPSVADRLHAALRAQTARLRSGQRLRPLRRHARRRHRPRHLLRRRGCDFACTRMACRCCRNCSRSSTSSADELGVRSLRAR